MWDFGVSCVTGRDNGAYLCWRDLEVIPAQPGWSGTENHHGVLVEAAERMMALKGE